MIVPEGQFEAIDLPKGAVIFTQGQRPDSAFILVRGEVSIFKMVESRRVVLAHLRSGALFGEMGVIDSTSRMASAVTMTRASLLVIPADVVGQKMERADPFLRALVSILVENLRSVHNAYVVKPRSLHDLVRVLADNAESMRRYAINAQGMEVFPRVAAMLDRLDGVVDQLDDFAAETKDRRGDVIPREASPSALAGEKQSFFEKDTTNTYASR